MSLDIIKAQLEEELDRKKRALSAFQDRYDKNSIRGSVLVKKIRNTFYYYVRTNDKGTIKTTYIGKVNEVPKESIEQIQKEVDLYKHDKKVIKELNEDISKLEKVIKIL